MSSRTHQLWAGTALLIAGAALALMGDRAPVYGVVAGVGILLILTSYGSDKE